MEARTPLQRAVPAARTIDLVTTQSNDEVLVYDQQAHHIHHLNATAADVWRLCDGERTVSDIAVETRPRRDAVQLALRTLEDAQLLDGELATAMREHAEPARVHEEGRDCRRSSGDRLDLRADAAAAACQSGEVIASNDDRAGPATART